MIVMLFCVMNIETGRLFSNLIELSLFSKGYFSGHFLVYHTGGVKWSAVIVPQHDMHGDIEFG